MNQDKIHFRKFLNLCLQNSLTVWADCHLLVTRQSTGHWNGADHISVYRPKNKNEVIGLIPNISSENKIDEFIDDSPAIKWEMAVLLHEYGHWFYKHPHISTIADKSLAYQHEVDAWNKGEEVGRSLGMLDFSIFYAGRDSALRGYRQGFGLGD